MAADIDARRLIAQQFSPAVQAGVWSLLLPHDPTRVRVKISGVPPYQLATRPDAGYIFAYVPVGFFEYELRRDLDADICTGEIWIFCSSTEPAIFGYHVIDTHGNYYVKEA